MSLASRCGDRQDGGFVTIQYVIAIALSLLLLVLVGNLLVDLYARGAVRDALDEGVRAAVPVDTDANACVARASSVLSGLVRGPVADVDVDCRLEGNWVVADAQVSMRSWLPLLVPDWKAHYRAEALREG